MMLEEIAPAIARNQLAMPENKIAGLGFNCASASIARGSTTPWHEVSGEQARNWRLTSD